MDKDDRSDLGSEAQPDNEEDLLLEIARWESEGGRIVDPAPEAESVVPRTRVA